jgi:tripartite-type tricarboxylate transporter receptor subunit TctC
MLWRCLPKKITGGPVRQEGLKMTRFARKMILAIGVAASFLSIMSDNISAQDQTYPTRTIRLVVPYVAGGGVDSVARIVAEKLFQTSGKSAIVDNRPGGSTNIGTELVAKSVPDGYTLLVGSVPTTVNVTLFKNLNFNIIKDFIPVSLLTTTPNILVVHPSVPAKSVKELVAYAKAHPGKLTFGTAGRGTANHLSGELLKMVAGIDILHVPYKGGAQAITDLLGGYISMYFGTASTVMPHVRSGKLRALGVLSDKRTIAAPDVPTFLEAGLPGVDQPSWQGLFAPAGTPAPIITTLSKEVVRVIKLPDTIKKLTAQEGFDVIGSTPEEFADFIKQDVAKYEKIIKTANIRIE